MKPSETICRTFLARGSTGVLTNFSSFTADVHYGSGSVVTTNLGTGIYRVCYTAASGEDGSVSFFINGTIGSVTSGQVWNEEVRVPEVSTEQFELLQAQVALLESLIGQSAIPAVASSGTGDITHQLHIHNCYGAPIAGATVWVSTTPDGLTQPDDTGYQTTNENGFVSFSIDADTNVYVFAYHPTQAFTPFRLNWPSS